MKLCLIGSTRFAEQYDQVNRDLTLMGHVVYSVATVGVSPGEEKVKKGKAITDEEKETLDLVHLIKIMQSDACVLITDIHGYVGISTKREIRWAMMLGKQVILPNNVIGFADIQKKFYEDWLPGALAERAGLDLHSKIKI